MIKYKLNVTGESSYNFLFLCIIKKYQKYSFISVFRNVFCMFKSLPSQFGLNKVPSSAI